MKRKLNLENPQTFNEKMQWLKIHDRKDIYTKLVDKYEVKKIIGEIIGEEYIIPTLGVWNKFDDIEFDKLPDKFVLKCTHDSGGLYICNDSTKFDIEQAREKITSSLKHNFFWSGREWPYKNVMPQIIAEPFIEDNELKELRDYKFFCFDGNVKVFKVDFGRFTEHHANYYDKNMQLLLLQEKEFPRDEKMKIIFPITIGKMIEMAESLSRGFSFVRIDFYDVNGHIYFGEITLYPNSGYGVIEPEEWDYKLGEWIKLPERG